MVAGDVFIVAEGYQSAANGDSIADKWYVCSSSEVYRRGDDIMVRRSITHGGGQYKLNPQKDLLIRAWNPHPRRYDAADSTVRAILPVLRELEQCTKRVFAELDSRLAGAGILLLPDNIDFPRVPTENPGDPQPTGVEGFSALLQRTMATSMQQRDSAAAVVPIILQASTDALDKIKHLTFDSQISDKIGELRKDAVSRMAMSLDIPPEVLTGMGASNHWSSWQIEESSIKIHIEPLLIQLADALNIGYFQPALKAAGIQNPEKHTLWFDVGPLAVRPNRSDQALQFAEKEFISAKAARDNAAFTDDDAPDDEERVYNIVKALLQAQPAYAADPEVQKILGLPKIAAPAAPGAAPEDSLMPGDPGYDEAGTEPADAGARGLPQLPSVADAEAGKVGGQKLGQLAASLNADVGGGRLFFAADSAVRRALELAGGRLVPGPQRARYPVPKHELHTRVQPQAARVPALLAGAWTHVREQAPFLGVDPDALEELLGGYCTELLTRGVAHDGEMLRSTLLMARGDLTP
jgi:catechol 2,3-dioxygenase-like lactoylglutathione lyase family enzyme